MVYVNKSTKSQTYQQIINLLCDERFVRHSTKGAGPKAR